MPDDGCPTCARLQEVVPHEVCGKHYEPGASIGEGRMSEATAVQIDLRLVEPSQEDLDRFTGLMNRCRFVQAAVMPEPPRQFTKREWWREAFGSMYAGDREFNFAAQFIRRHGEIVVYGHRFELNGYQYTVHGRAPVVEQVMLINRARI